MAKTFKLTGGKKVIEALTFIEVKAKNSALLNVGFPKGGTEPDGESTPLVAFINEYGRIVRSKEGDYYQMPRPFFRNMIAKGEKTWGAALAKCLIAADYDAVEALKQMGDEMVGELKESIQELYYPPLAPSTIAHKKFAQQPTKPLIDSGNMLNSADSWVEEKE